MHDFPEIDLKNFADRLVQMRKAAHKTQEQAAGHIGLSRPTYFAIEKGLRDPTPAEIIGLAEFFHRPLHELIRFGSPIQFSSQLAAAFNFASVGAREVSASIGEFERFAEDYRELERLLDAPLPTNFPPEVTLPRRGGPIDFAEGAAMRERARLQLGEQPIPNLRQLLENEVGVRIFFGALPDRVEGLYAFSSDAGCCMMINQASPRERRLACIVREYGHLLVERRRAKIDFVDHASRKRANDRFAEAFAVAFLMPAAAIRRHFQEMYDASGDFEVGDLIRLANLYGAGPKATTARLESLGLLPKGNWTFVIEQGLRENIAKRELKLDEEAAIHDSPYSERYKSLAVRAFVRDKITERQLADYLRCDRVEAREIVARAALHVVVGRDGKRRALNPPLGKSLAGRRQLGLAVAKH